MHLIALSFLAGVVVVVNLTALPAQPVVLLIIPLLVIATFSSKFRWAWAFPIGLCWAVWMAHLQLTDLLAPALEGKPLIVRGVIVEAPVIINDRQRFVIEISHLIELDVKNKLQVPSETENISPVKIRINWYHANRTVDIGETWQLVVKLKRNHGFANPGGFDYEGWLFRQNIAATGYVLDQYADENQKLGSQSSPWLWLQKVRADLSREIKENLGNLPFAGLLIALAIGDKQSITTQQWDVLTATGTNHLMAISGLHIGLVAGLLFFLVQRLWCFSARGLLIISAPKAAGIAAVLAAFGYAALAGFSIPTQRAFIMIVVVMFAVIRQRSVRPTSVLSLALLLVLLWDPFAVMDAGFWLSFAAVGVIFFAMGSRLAQRSIWWRWGRVQWIVAIGLTPFLFVLFNTVPIISPIANLIAVPVMGLIVVPVNLLGTLMLSISPMPGSFLLEIAHFSLALLWPLLSLLAEPQWLTWQGIAPPLWCWPIAVAGVGWLLLPQGMPARWVGAVGLLPLLTAGAAHPEKGDFHVTILDVGQGFAAVVQTAGHTLVYDTGPTWHKDFDTGDAVVVPYLRHSGAQQVDALVLSHDDIDHVGGANSVLEQIRVHRIFASFQPKLAALTANTQVSMCTRGTKWHWDGVDFEVLHPSDANAHVKDNDKSCVLRVNNNRHSILFTGDIEKKVERQMLEVYQQENKPLGSNSVSRQQLNAQVLIVPHHGSKTSSSMDFIDAVQPKLAIFSAGYRNRYGFPRPEVKSRYAQRGIEMLDTISSGAIQLSLANNDEQLGIMRHREKYRRFWHWQALITNSSAAAD